jgi:protein-disulfide isomerase
VAKTVKKQKSNARFVGTLVLIAIAGIGVLGYSLSRPRAGVKPVDPNLIASTAQPYILGNPDAPVKIIEFADFECPACARWAQLIEPDVRERLVNTGLASYQIFDFPLDMHPNAWPAHNAVACAAEQGKFDAMHTAVFNTHEEWTGQYGKTNPAPGLRKAAQSSGVDLGLWDACFDSQKHYPRIKANQQEGLKLGVGGTPAFIIGGNMYPSPLTYDEVKKAVDDATAAAAAASKGAKAPPKAPGKSGS